MSAGFLGTLVPVGPRDRCRRCDHEARVHLQPWGDASTRSDWTCHRRVGTDWERTPFGTTKERPLYCPCDGFQPKEAA